MTKYDHVAAEDSINIEKIPMIDPSSSERPFDNLVNKSPTPVGDNVA